MKSGRHISLPLGKIDYKQLRRVNPEAARRPVTGYLKTNSHNIQKTALVFRITRPVIYSIMRKQGEGDLKDRSRAPDHQPNRTPAWIEDKIIEDNVRTRHGAERLSRYRKQHEGILISPGTIRYVLRRNKGRSKYSTSGRVRKEKREYIDWHSAKPLVIIHVDLEYGNYPLISCKHFAILYLTERIVK